MRFINFIYGFYVRRLFNFDHYLNMIAYEIMKLLLSFHRDFKGILWK